MKRLIKKSNKNYVDEYGLEAMEKVFTDVGSWISGGRCWFDNPDEVVQKWMTMFPDYVHTGEAYRLLAFQQSALNDCVNQIFNVDVNNVEDSNLSTIIVSTSNIMSIADKLVSQNNDYVSWTKDNEKHNNFHDFYKDFNGDEDCLLSIKSNIKGFYVTEFNHYLNEALYNKNKEQYDKESLQYDGVNYSDQDEIIAPTGKFELYMINQIPVSELSGLNLIDFINKVSKSK